MKDDLGCSRRDPNLFTVPKPQSLDNLKILPYLCSTHTKYILLLFSRSVRSDSLQPYGL